VVREEWDEAALEAGEINERDRDADEIEMDSTEDAIAWLRGKVRGATWISAGAWESTDECFRTGNRIVTRYWLRDFAVKEVTAIMEALK
jgi:hypothetical protein